MFTGIVEEMGCVASRARSRLVLEARAALEGTGLGSSVAVNGVCLTVVEREDGRLAFDVGPETYAVSALGDLAPGDHVNLERPLRLGDFVGGHLVPGHVDGIGVVTSAERAADLTVATLDDRAFEIMVIPHTLAVTTLGTARPGRRVNLETDMIGKYVIRALGPGMAGAVGGTQS